jgi:hypothetical protein
MSHPRGQKRKHAPSDSATTSASASTTSTSSENGRPLCKTEDYQQTTRQTLLEITVLPPEVVDLVVGYILECIRHLTNLEWATKIWQPNNGDDRAALVVVDSEKFLDFSIQKHLTLFSNDVMFYLIEGRCGDGKQSTWCLSDAYFVHRVPGYQWKSGVETDIPEDESYSYTLIEPVLQTAAKHGVIQRIKQWIQYCARKWVFTATVVRRDTNDGVRLNRVIDQLQSILPPLNSFVCQSQPLIPKS